MTRLGYQIPNFTYPDTTPATLFDVIAAQAREADASGFDTVLVMDHFYQLPMIGPAEFEMLECYSLLSALARHVRSIELAGEPEVTTNMAVHGHEKLPLRIVPA